VCVDVFPLREMKYHYIGAGFVFLPFYDSVWFVL
jgi:hypothetical protein